jgi:hypothetical protein
MWAPMAACLAMLRLLGRNRELIGAALARNARTEASE